jgi:hypothetical protein
LGVFISVHFTVGIFRIIDFMASASAVYIQLNGNNLKCFTSSL